MGVTALDLNTQEEELPPVGSFQGRLRSGQPAGYAEGSSHSPPVHARSASRTLGLRGPRSSGGGGAMTSRAISSVSGGGLGASLPPVPAGVRGARRSASGVADGSMTSGKRPRLPTPAVAEDTFGFDNSNSGMADGSRTSGRRPQLPTPAITEDNFGLDNPNTADVVEILPNDPTVCYDKLFLIRLCYCS